MLARNVKLVKSSNPYTGGADAVASIGDTLDPFETNKWPTRGAEATGTLITARTVLLALEPPPQVATRANENVSPGISCRAGMERCAGLNGAVAEILPDAVASNGTKQNRLLVLAQTHWYDVQLGAGAIQA